EDGELDPDGGGEGAEPGGEGRDAQAGEFQGEGAPADGQGGAAQGGEGVGSPAEQGEQDRPRRHRPRQGGRQAITGQEAVAPDGHHRQAGQFDIGSRRGRRQGLFDRPEEGALAVEVAQAQTEGGYRFPAVGADGGARQVAGQEAQGGVD